MNTPATDDLATFCSSLALNASGELVDAATGEVVDLDDRDAVRRLCGTVLDLYARAVHQVEALRLKIQERRQPLVEAASAAVEQQLQGDPDYQTDLVEHARLTAVIGTIVAGLNGALQDRDGDRAISLDAGTVLLTYPKARETWKLAKPASWYGTAAAKRSLQRALAHAQQDGQDAADVVLRWLDPTSTLGDLPAAKITLRSPDAAGQTSR